MKRRIAILVALTVIGCGGTGKVSPAAGRATASATLPAPAAPLPLTIATGTGVACGRWFVLAPHNAAYTTSELRAMADYLSTPPYSDATPPTLDSALATIDTPGAMGKYWNEPICNTHLQITNTGPQTVQIPKVGIELTGDATPNADQYRLVEACTLQANPDYCGPQKGGGPTSCDLYYAKVVLASGSKGSTTLDAPVAKQMDGSTCPEITLPTNASVEISLDVASAAALSYPVRPVIVAVAAAGTQQVPVNRAATQIKFAAPAQFACYQLQGQTFQPRWSGADAVDWHGRSQDHAWCA
jgi:hypothetical protein